jgi:hypothetical protein
VAYGGEALHGHTLGRVVHSRRFVRAAVSLTKSARRQGGVELREQVRVGAWSTSVHCQSRRCG